MARDEHEEWRDTPEETREEPGLPVEPDALVDPASPAAPDPEGADGLPAPVDEPDTSVDVVDDADAPVDVMDDADVTVDADAVEDADVAEGEVADDTGDPDAPRDADAPGDADADDAASPEDPLADPAPPAWHARLRAFLATDAGTRRVARVAAGVALASGFAAGVAGLVRGLTSLAAPLLLVSLLALTGAAFIAGQRPPAPERADAPKSVRFRRTVALNATIMVLYLAYLLLGLVEILTIPAALGYLAFFGSFALGFLWYFPAILFTFIAGLAGAFLLHLGDMPRKPLDPRARTLAFTALAALGVFMLAAVLVQAGLAGLKPERAVFMLAGGQIAAFVFVAKWTRMPTFHDVTKWMEHEERLHRTNVLRNLVVAFLTLAAVGAALALLAGARVLPHATGAIGLFLAFLFLLPATLNVGVRRFIAKVHAAGNDMAEDRKRARVILASFSIGLTVLGGALAVLGVLAFLAQVVGVAVFEDLLRFLAAEYLIVLTVALVPLAAAVFTRTRVTSEEVYTDRRKAVTLMTSLATVVLGFLGAFIASGLALGTGIEIENAVLFMIAAVVALTAFVKARALLPSVTRLALDAVKQTENADRDLKENIQRRMMLTYVGGLVFVVVAVAYLAATVLGVIPKPGGGAGTDAAFFLYVVVGVVILMLVLVRYFQGLAIDPAWKRKKEGEDARIGRKRMSASELQKFILLGMSGTLALVLFLTGVLIQFGVLSTLGPLALEERFATDFFVFAILIGLGPYGYYHNRELARIRSIDTRFPDFLRDLAESQRAGMTLTEAVITASKGNYGMLTPEIRKMAAQIQWGISFSDALERFAKRVRTPLIERTVSLIVQAGNAGGNVVDVLGAAADDARDIQQILKDRKQSMSIYVMIIYIAFFVFIGVVGVLNAQFLPEVGRAVSAAAESGGGSVSLGGMTLRPIDEQAFRTVFFHAAIVQGFGGGLVAGVMDGGKPQSGLKHAFIMVTIAYVIFRFLIGG